MPTTRIESGVPRSSVFAGTVLPLSRMAFSTRAPLLMTQDCMMMLFVTFAPLSTTTPRARMEPRTVPWISQPAEMSEFAPRIITTSVPVEKIGEVIGPKGKMINQIQEDTGAEIAIEDDGTVFISSEGGEAAEKAKAIIDQIANPHVPEAGETYNGKVVKTTSFGAFVNLTPGTDGLLHISRVANGRVGKVEDVLNLGDIIKVEVLEVDPKTGKISLDRLDKPKAPEGSGHGSGEGRPRRESRDRSERPRRRPGDNGRGRAPRRHHEG